jgi:hypothetical protein
MSLAGESGSSMSPIVALSPAPVMALSPSGHIAAGHGHRAVDRGASAGPYGGAAKGEQRGV